MKSKVIRTILETCREPEARGAQVPARAGRRSPAAGGGLAGAAPPAAPTRKAAHSDPRLGQSLEARRAPRRGSRRRWSPAPFS